MKVYNPASLQTRDTTGFVDVMGVVSEQFPDGTVTDLGRGAVAIATAASPGAGLPTLLSPTATPPTFLQDGTNPRLWTIQGTDVWVRSSIRLYFKGQRLDTPLFVITGTGNRTITLDATVPIELGDYVEGDGVKA